MDKQVYKILSLIEDNHKEAYIVGGYVRDYLLNIKSYDYDICTNCNIDILHEILKDYTLKQTLGTISIKMDDITIEITPYRKELEYKNRKPSKYIPADTLYEDLMRRDFTINTICMNKNGDIIDLLNGRDDIEKGIIRMVGDVNQKLEEDPLRILRALRFSAKYEFKLDNNLKLAIKNHSQLINTLSITRKREELDKLIDLHQLEILKEYNFDLDIDLNNIKYYNNKLLAWLKIDPKDIYVNNNKEKKIINKVRYLSNHVNDYNIYVYGLEISKLVSELNNQDLVTRYNNLPIKSRKDINITSYDIMEVTKTNINEIYQDIKYQIINHKLENKKEAIINYISR